MQKQTFEARRQRALETGVKFVKEFFNKLSGVDVEGVAGMYAKDAVMLDWKDTYEGEKAIREFYGGLKGQRKYAFTSLVCQPSVGEGVLIMAHGVQLTKEDSMHFSRTFYLTKDHSSAPYIIQNDVTELKTPPAAVPAPTPATPPSQPAASTTPAAPAPTPAAEPAPAPATGGTSWADLLKSKSGTPAPASAPQRVIGGVNQQKAEDAEGEKDKKSEKKPKQQKEGTGSGAKEADKDKKKRRAKSPTEKYQYAALYVSHIPPEMTEGDIEKLFSKFGKIKGKTFKSGQYCFIDFEDKMSVKSACSEQITFKGQTLTVQERKSPEQRAAEKLRKEKDKKKK
eukprot:TRINITY_DN6596_c0_g3_i1.p1 TRINITY_DN6596_c0_g3~~TRINITY_DN6596_c0_g3_i1.p1  ORF type:complete len:340 (+),score=107.06 TRINITY_DN6596_c0_g3_i1:159-1178(+)